jgi:hypothetical protein
MQPKITSIFYLSVQFIAVSLVSCSVSDPNVIGRETEEVAKPVVATNNGAKLFGNLPEGFTTQWLGGLDDEGFASGRGTIVYFNKGEKSSEFECEVKRGKASAGPFEQRRFLDSKLMIKTIGRLNESGLWDGVIKSTYPNASEPNSFVSKYENYSGGELHGKSLHTCVDGSKSEYYYVRGEAHERYDTDKLGNRVKSTTGYEHRKILAGESPEQLALREKYRAENRIAENRINQEANQGILSQPSEMNNSGYKPSGTAYWLNSKPSPLPRSTDFLRNTVAPKTQAPSQTSNGPAYLGTRQEQQWQKEGKKLKSVSQ